MMMDEPTEYGSLPDGEMKDCAEEMCKGKTVKDLRMLADYFSSKANDMDSEMEKSITMEQYEKLKNTDSAAEEESEV